MMKLFTNTVQIELGHQGNILFAFGKNDVPILPILVGSKEFDRGTSSVQIMNDPSNENQIIKNVSQQNNEQVELDSPKLELIQSKTVNSLHCHTHRENQALLIDEKKDIAIKEFCEQRQQELLESSEIVPVPVIEKNLILEEALFEDSFPEAVEMSALYRNCKNIEIDDVTEGDRNAGTKFSIEQEVKKVSVLKTQASMMQRENQQSKNDLQHSTPLADIVAGSSKRQRFTLQQNEPTSPVRTLSPPGNDNETDRKNIPFKVSCGDISQGLLAEFDKEFDSFGGDLDCSMDFNGEPPNDVQLHDHRLQGEIVKSDSVRLSDSVTAAMKALAEDTDFQSEELFPDGNESDPAVQPQNKHVPYNSKPESGRSDGLDDEDFISTQVSAVSEECIAKEEHDEFGESSSETESSSDGTNSSVLNHTNNSQSTEPTVHETMVGKVKITTRIVKSIDVIPSAFFSSSELVGIGMNLASVKKPSLSIARQGIGSRVISKNTAVNNTVLQQGESLHSIAVYNGSDTIWVLRWENENGLRVGGSKKVSTGNAKLEELLEKIESASCAVALFESKEKIKSLLRHCGIDTLSKLPPGERIWDPRIAQWIWDFDDEDWNISKRKLIDEYVTDAEKFITFSNLDKEVIEAFFAWKVMSALKQKLLTTGLWNHFVETEMPSVVPLLLMEMNGLGLDSSQLSKLKRVLQFKSALLELKAYELAGRQFNLNSPSDIKQILFREIGLKQPKNKGTGKMVLLKLDHKLPGVILEWRKVTSALQKVVIPFQQERNLETGRVHGQYSHFTATGRVVMADPSLQCIPRDFDIQISYDSDEVNELKDTCKIKFGSKLSALFQQLDNEAVDAYILNNISLISMRNAFIPCSDEFTILTADYSQLELRILAHLSEDEKLLEALNKDTDVFIEIAIQWKKLPRSKITNAIRQEAKGIVYGVIYGMGARSLSEQMEIEEREAVSLITQFMRTYPGISAFIDKAQTLCQEKGYVETMTGRRRYLPLIYSPVPHEKAKAVRQAINSQIQGSAADLVKTAMTRIHSFLISTYPKSALPVEWNKLCKARRSSVSVHSNSTHLKNLVFFPVLNLHDELIFEVRKSHLEEITKVVKREMESCVKLNVKLPVVIKTGDSWGTLTTYGDETE